MPRDLVATVDTREFAIAHPDVERERRRLERQLDLYVAAYDRSTKPIRNGLCSVYQVAELSAVQLRAIRDAEGRFAGVAFVAYVKPLRLRESDLAERGQ